MASSRSAATRELLSWLTDENSCASDYVTTFECRALLEFSESPLGSLLLNSASLKNRSQFVAHSVDSIGELGQASRNKPARQTRSSITFGRPSLRPT